ncbi:MAG: GNAT family N-acetyltransferase [Pseudomonadota bacterium]
MTKIFRPTETLLPGYADAQERGWSPNNVDPARTAAAHLAATAEDPAGFVASLEDLEAKGAPIVLPDGRAVPRLPGFARWIWQDGFCGSLSFRFQPGTSRLPSHVLGHIGYSIVPWRRREGHATRALALLLEEISRFGLSHVSLTVDPENTASQKVIEANGGVFEDIFECDPSYGGCTQHLYRIVLGSRP